MPDRQDDDLPPRQVGSTGQGIPVDFHGGPTVDPTKNVLDLVRAESKYQDAMRGELEKRSDAAIRMLVNQLKILNDASTAYQSAQRESETKRIDQLAQTRQEFQNTIRDMLAESVRTTSTLVSSQLVQIQATFNERVSKLEAGAFTQAGKQSVADPATSDAMMRLSSGLTSLKTNTDEAMSRLTVVQAEQLAKLTAVVSANVTSGASREGTRMGQGQVVAWIVGAAMLVAAIASPIIALLSMK